MFIKNHRKSNLSVTQQKALKSLKAKSREVKILPADKGNATVVMTNEQYKGKMEEHLGSETYSLLKKDPTESLARKLDVILKKLLKDKKISKQLHDDSRVLHPRSTQIYGLPKFINLAILSGPLYHFMAHLYQHSTNSYRIFFNLSRSLIFDLKTLKISLISLDRTWTLITVIIVPWMSNLYTPRAICISQWTSSWKKLKQP